MDYRICEAMLAAGLAIVSVAAAAQDPSPEVRTGNGLVIGTVQGDTAAFLGIPYAAPPVGDLRFRPPQPHASWSTPLSATTPGSPCPQLLNASMSNQASTDEDCLYLNVWTRLRGRGDDQGGLPVMVWVHGGGFQFGSGSLPYYNGALLAGSRDVVVVTINYRLGALGFLTAPALDAESPTHTSGNYGIEDQQAALRWVHDNIASFGGDPQNVTFFGESGGGISGEYALVSPGASGLFERVIIQSAADNGSAPTLAASETGFSAGIIANAGCSTASDVAACMRAVPAANLLSSMGLSPTNAGPVIDGVVIPDQPINLLNAGRFHRVPTIIGSTHDEYTALVWPLEIPPNPPLSAAAYAGVITSAYGSNAAAILGEYPASAYQSPIQALAAAETDGNIACPTDQARQALERYVPVYSYEFSEPDPAQGSLLGPPVPGLTYGVYHTSDVPYVFGSSAPDGAPLTGKDVALSQKIMAYWSDLADSGSPNRPPGDRVGPYWPDYRTSNTLLSLKDTPSELADSAFQQEHNCSFWNNLPPS